MGIPELEIGNTKSRQFHTEVVARNGDALNFHLVIRRRVREETLAFQADSLRESNSQPLVVNKPFTSLGAKIDMGTASNELGSRALICWGFLAASLLSTMV